MSEVSIIELVDLKGSKTSDIECCGNKGCGYNANGTCTANGTECFGYIKALKDNTKHKESNLP